MCGQGTECLEAEEVTDLHGQSCIACAGYYGNSKDTVATQHKKVVARTHAIHIQDLGPNRAQLELCLGAGREVVSSRSAFR